MSEKTCPVKGCENRTLNEICPDHLEEFIGWVEYQESELDVALYNYSKSLWFRQRKTLQYQFWLFNRQIEFLKKTIKTELNKIPIIRRFI